MRIGDRLEAAALAGAEHWCWVTPRLQDSRYLAGKGIFKVWFGLQIVSCLLGNCSHSESLAHQESFLWSPEQVPQIRPSCPPLL